MARQPYGCNACIKPNGWRFLCVATVCFSVENGMQRVDAH